MQSTDRDNIAHRKVEKTLSSLDRIPDLAVNPFFYTRLRQAISEQESERAGWLYRVTNGYRMLPVAIGLILILNVVTLTVFLQFQQTSRENQTNIVDDVVREYSLTSWNFSDNRDGG